MLAKPLRLLLLGAPGSGKGTQTSRLLRRFPTINTLASGDILRSEISQRTKVGIQAQNFIKNGELVPDNTMVELITSQMLQRQLLNGNSSWLLDGFPRTLGQAQVLHTMLTKSHADINMVVELDVDQSVILDRIEARWVHGPSGRLYNLHYNPPKVPYTDDVTGEPLTKRVDDTAEVFQKRLDKYNSELLPLKEFYRSLGVLHTVCGNTSDIIYPKLEELVVKTFG
jgi:adenylate kinase